MAPIIAEDPVTFTSALEARRESVTFLARLLHQRRGALGTRSGMRAPGPFRQAVLALRWFLDNTRMRQPATDNAISASTAYDYLHEAIDVLAELAPSVHDALLAAKASGATHVNLDGTPIHTDRVATRGPNGADPISAWPCWPRPPRCTAANWRYISARRTVTGWPATATPC